MPFKTAKSTHSIDAVTEAVRQRFNMPYWTEGYFDIDPDGTIVCRPQADAQLGVKLDEVMQSAVQSEISLPLLLRFPDILTDRVKCVCRAFDQVRESLVYQAPYTLVYPVKVNQQRCVVEQIVNALPGRVGLEAGSKPELMAVLAQTFQKNNEHDVETIICNGYKDREYIRLALIGAQLGKRVFIVIEQPDELMHIMQQAALLGVQPNLGVRVRLGSIAKGRWQNSGGDKSKFGLSATQLLELVELLKQHNYLQHLHLLHCHVGSQVTDLADLQTAMLELVRIFQDLHCLGAAVSVVDVGGGLGVDYEGLAQDSLFSMNYDIADYAHTIVSAFAQHCAAHHLPAPEIISESGRALAAHHAVLITNVVDVERLDAAQPDMADRHPLADKLVELAEQAQQVVNEEQALLVLSACESILKTIHQTYIEGAITLSQRSMFESLLTYAQLCLMQATADSQGCLSIYNTLTEKLADKFFCNFSLFQSLPDIWALQQVFPIMPLQRLNEPFTRHAVLHDLTCDSDGQIGRYPQQGLVAPTLPVHEVRPDQPYYLCVFLVGAYQEILGDMHNLFGDTNSVNVVMSEDGTYQLEGAELGDRIDQLLEYVHYDTHALLQQYKIKLDSTDLSEVAKQQYYAELQDGLKGYTYLED